MSVHLLLNCPSMTKLTVRRPRRIREAGFNIIEMVFTLGIMAVITGVAVVQINTTKPAMVGDSGMRVIIYYMNQAREMAITQRRNMRVVFTAPNQIDIKREEVPGPTLTTIASVVMEGKVIYQVTTGLPDTPDAFGNSSATNFKVGSVDATEIKFAPDGTLVNENGKLMNGSVFVAFPSQSLSSRAVTVMGSTGRVRGYRWNGRAWKPV